MEIKTLRKLRESSEKSMEEAAKWLGITYQYLSMLELGKKNPSDKLKEKMAEFYGVSVHYIFLSIKQTKSLFNNTKPNNNFQKDV